MAEGDVNSVAAGDPGSQAAGGIAGLFGKKTAKATGPNAAAYTGQMNTAQNTANNYNGLSTNYTQNAPTIANTYQAQSRGDIGNNIGDERSLANTLAHNTGEASKAQFQSGLDQSVDAQMAMANSAPGGAVSRAGAMRNAQQTGARMQAQGAATAAELGAHEREVAQGQAAGVYNNVGGQLQSQYGLEQGSAIQQAQLQSQNQAQQNSMRLGYGQLGNQAQGQSEQALNDYTDQSTKSQDLSYGIKQGNAQDTNNIIGAIGGVAGGAASAIGGLFAEGGVIHGGGEPTGLATYYGPITGRPQTREASIAEALAGIEHLKAHVAKISGYHGG